MTIIVTTGGQPVESIPVPIPSNARIASFLPYAQIMSEIDLLVTNGGYGTVNMAISHGIPVISAGLTEDKEEVSAHVQWSGAGMNQRTKQTTSEAIEHAVDEIFTQPRYHERVQQLSLEFAIHDVKAELLCSASSKSVSAKRSAHRLHAGRSSSLHPVSGHRELNR